MTFSRSFLPVLYLLILGTGYALAQTDSTQIGEEKKKLSFKDPEDGAIDLSQFLLEANGVLPVLIPITEPAVGYGGSDQAPQGAYLPPIWELSPGYWPVGTSCKTRPSTFRRGMSFWSFRLV